MLPWEYITEPGKKYTDEHGNVLDKNPNEKEFVQKFYDEHTKLTQAMGKKELSAISTGDTHRLKTTAQNDNVFAAFRYNAESQVLVIGHDANLDRGRVKDQPTVRKNNTQPITFNMFRLP